MVRLLKLRKKHGFQAIPDVQRATMGSRFRGFPILDGTRGADDWHNAAKECPTNAIDAEAHALDMGKCIFCGFCEHVSNGAIHFTTKYKLGTTEREQLILHPSQTSEDYEKHAVQSRSEIQKIFGKSLKLRQVSAGGCNGCEMELNAAGNVNFDMGRFGIDFVASPRHADGIVVTGPVTKNMADALRDAYTSTPDPKIVILVGTCAISGGIFAESQEIDRQPLNEFKCDLYIPGCPPHPLTFINALLDFLKKS